MAKKSGNSFEDTVKEFIENAPEATGGTYVQYGKLTCQMNVITWKGKGETPDKEPFEEGMEIDPAKQALEIEFSVYVKELNDNLQRDDWTRRIQVKTSNKKGTVTTDWSETVRPSLEKVFGAKWYDVVMGKINPYVECEQAPSQFVRAGSKDYGVPKFLRVFKNKTACIEARDERYGNPAEADDFDFSEDNDLGVPKKVVKQAQTLYESLDGDKKKLMKMFKTTEPFNEYDADAIWEELDKDEDEEEE